MRPPPRRRRIRRPKTRQAPPSWSRWLRRFAFSGERGTAAAGGGPAGGDPGELAGRLPLAWPARERGAYSPAAEMCMRIAPQFGQVPAASGTAAPQRAPLTVGPLGGAGDGLFHPPPWTAPSGI